MLKLTFYVVGIDYYNACKFVKIDAIKVGSSCTKIRGKKMRENLKNRFQLDSS
jgi:hypothetical protein